MQREIKFRGKTLTGNWVYGYYSLLPKFTLPVAMMGEDSYCEDGADYIIEFKTMQHPNFSNAYPLQVCDKEVYEVIPETVGQYTGLKDKNGKEIYEGDIVKLKDYHGERVVKIDFHNGVYYYAGDGFSDEYLFNSSDLEVICTIHDNPELLEADNP